VAGMKKRNDHAEPTKVERLNKSKKSNYFVIHLVFVKTTLLLNGCEYNVLTQVFSCKQVSLGNSGIFL